MTPPRRRVIADSDDEVDLSDDGGQGNPKHDSVSGADRPGGAVEASDLGAGRNTPEPEPLSPLHRPEHKSSNSTDNQRSTDTTDPAWFAAVYEEERQDIARRHGGHEGQLQDNLVENIVRQSQKASAASATTTTTKTSSSEVSLPAKGKKKKKKQAANLSSATDVTSPVVLTTQARSRNHPSQLGEDDTQVTTPRKNAATPSNPRETPRSHDPWEVPSSAEGNDADRPATRSATKRRKSQPTLTPAEMYGADQHQHDGAAGGDPALPDTAPSALDTPRPPSSKRKKVSLHDTQHTTSAGANFFVAPSHMTTMQKLEYQRVSVSAGGSSLSVPVNGQGQQRSSGATTIPYSTPSRYASSGPPLPWERPDEEEDPAVDAEGHLAAPLSSPDVITEDTSPRRHQEPPSSTSKSRVVADDVQPYEPVPTQVLPKSKRRKLLSAEELDELSHNEDAGQQAEVAETAPAGTAKRRSPQRRRRTRVADSDEEDELMQEDTAEAAVPADAVVIIDDDDAVAEATLAGEADEAPQPKKRGRKKKQPQSAGQQEEKAPDAAAEAVAEKPKKKRGRPRKSDPPKVAESAVANSPGTEAGSPGKPDGKPLAEEDDAPAEMQPAQQDQEGEALGDEDEDEEEEAPRARGRPKKTAKAGSKKRGKAVAAASADPETTLQEVNGNLGTVNSSEPSEDAKEKTTPKPPTKQSEAVVGNTVNSSSNLGGGAKPAGSQGVYRVGLSRKTRIAPLLKSIRK